MAEVLVFTTPPAFAVILAAFVVRLHGHLTEFRDDVAATARTDSLTGLLNRRAFEELLELELTRARESGRPVSVVLGSIAGLQEAGREPDSGTARPALQSVAGELIKWKRRSDHAARIGDGVIALVLPDTDEGGALILAERLRRAAQLNLGDLPVRVSMSFGVASHPWHGADAWALRSAAEQAMNAARVRGGQRALIYGAEVARVRMEAAAPLAGSMRAGVLS
jgi:diguanylate cyclase (GGDEF)-like protein